MTLDDLRKQAEAVQHHMNAITNLLSLAAITNRPERLRAIKVVMEYESANMRRESDRLNEMMGEFKKEQGGMRRNVLIMAVLAILMFVLVAGIPAVAQDVTPLATNTAAAVVEPIVNDVPVEATVEPSPTVTVTYLPTRDELLDTFMKYWLAIALVGILVFGTVFYRVAVLLALGVPQFAWDGAKGGLLSAEKQLEQRVKDSETPVDDALYPYVQKLLQKALDEIDAKRTTTITLTPQNDSAETRKAVADALYDAVKASDTGLG